MIDKKRLIDKTNQIFPDITNCIDKLEIYSKLLIDYNKKVNLTAITDPIEMEDKHFVDCLSLAAQPFIKGEICDVGSGAGFPGLVIAIARPDTHLTLVEPTAKRCRFLQLICDELDLDAEIVNARAEEIGRDQLRASFDVVTARAVASLPVLLEYCLPLCKKNGVFVAMKGEAESLENAKAAKLLGGDGGTEIVYSLPKGDFRRLLVFEKIKNTPSEYPRNGGRIAKKPL